MTSEKKRRVTVRRPESGASDPIQKARQAGIREGRALAKAEYERAMAAAVARAKADERAVRDEVMALMEKEIEDLTLRCAQLEKGKSAPTLKVWTSDNSKDWIAQFDEDN
jgi:protein-disulfide isomerase-like protein with CxxC motif